MLQSSRGRNAVAALWNCPAVGLHKVPAVLEVALDAVAAFVHQRVMPGAQQHQVREAGFAVVRPMLDVMTVQEAVVVAARESAAAMVSRIQGALDGLRDDARLAADAQRFAVLTLGQHNGMPVAAKPLH